MADRNATPEASRPVIPSAMPRTEMIQNAVSFLADPKVQESPISERIGFLESKGLTPQEVDMALAQASRPVPSTSSQYSGGYPMMPAYPPQPPRTDWRDLFIMAVVSGSIGYGLFGLARAPNQSVLEKERDELSAKYDEVALHLEELDQTTEAIRQGLDEQQTAVQQSVVGVNEMVDQVRVREEQREKDFEKMKAEVEEMREEFSSMLNRSRKSQISALTDLQGELKSLRSLIVSRGGLQTQSSSTQESSKEDSEKASAPRPAPSIPAWQLEDPAEES
ncbi:peroxisomal membrane protein pex14 [Malassezia yamatoensis]|uniref:Peroxisomal membrane protein PEX14 n=1 Tax=Malassezia yamatoensis TaxID=253288 RepID=A0AAJ6CG55_9BASI|nr:peroxisomal membrane protein pex14 [Malassezia yamatoensis]